MMFNYLDYVLIFLLAGMVCAVIIIFIARFQARQKKPKHNFHSLAKYKPNTDLRYTEVEKSVDENKASDSFKIK